MKKDRKYLNQGKKKIAWSKPNHIKEIKHEGFGGNLNPKWQWPKGTVVQPLYKGWINMDKKYGIKKKKKKIFVEHEKNHGRNIKIF